jgi:hypothetical protein
MSEKIARLRAIESNIDRYERLLESDLSETELRFVRGRIAEERFALAILQAVSPAPSMGRKLPDALH